MPLSPHSGDTQAFLKATRRSAAYVAEQIAAGTSYIESLPPQQAAAAVVAVTALLTISCVISTTPLNFVSGAIFGPLLGALIFNVGCTVGSFISFLIGRFLLKSWAQRKLRESPTLSALDSAIRKKAGQMVVLARLSPVFPFAIVGYALGATSLDLVTFTWATFAGLFPGCLLYAFIGASAKEAASGDGGWGPTISMAGGVAATVLVTVQAKRAYDEAIAEAKKEED